MDIKPLRSVIIIVCGAAIIAILTLLIRFQPNREIDKADVEIIRNLCNRNSIVAEQYRNQATRIKKLLKSGEVDRRRDLAFRSGEFNEGIYVPHPDAKLRKHGIKINITEVYLQGNKVLEMRMPVIFIRGPSITISAPKHREQTCLDLFKNDFVDYL